MRTWELAIVGGGPAGLSTALHLAARAPALAARTLVLERERYPRDKTCAGAIGARAVAQLAAIGVDVDLGGALPAVAVHGFEVRLGEATPVRVREPGAAWVIRRDAFDARLAAELVRRGVALQSSARVIGLRRDAGGVTLELEGQPSVRARAVVGADGITGVVRRAIGLPRGALRAQAVEVDTERVDGDPPPDTIRFAFRPELRGYLWDFPTPLGGRVMMSRGVYLLRDQRAVTADAQGHLRAHLGRVGLDLGRHAPRQLAERGLEPRAPSSTSRVLLVGEAAGIDFPTGEGIAQAIAHGACAAAYLAEALPAGRLDFAEWGARWMAADEGRFLRRRLLGGRALYGRGRATIERALARSPRVFSVVLRRFAGRPVARTELARAAVQLGAALGREALTSARR